MTTPEWEEFEIAVSNFVAALDTQAKVQHNVSLPDKHTGIPRQRDIWVEAKICQLFPVTVYISCKRKNKKMNQQDIDAFHGELISSGAHKGVIYSYSGYTKPAVEKAKNLGISLCGLYRNCPPDIPDVLIIPRAYCCIASIGLSLIKPIDSRWNLSTWQDLFDIGHDYDDGTTFLDIIAKEFLEAEKKALKSISSEQVFPSDWGIQLELPNQNHEIEPIRLSINGIWKIYLGKLEGHLVDGSYSFTDNTFIGRQSTPIIDTRGPAPGPDWVLLKERPNKLEKNYCIVFLYGAKVKDALLTNLGTRKLDIRKR